MDVTPISMAGERMCALSGHTPEDDTVQQLVPISGMEPPGLS